ncbi:MAG TPA: NTP transferase domain-containing protein [Nannocystaceae bacterium]|nr:NTP transferase domain-containing protein [Nannocystaceae bacterium]
MILAAGLGSRLRTQDDASVKPLTPVGGVPIVFRALRGLETAGCDRIVVVVGFRAESLVAAITAGAPTRAPITFVDNPRYDLANGVSLLSARPELGDEFVVAMADHVVGDEVMGLAAAHTPAPGGATLLVDRRVDGIFDLDDATKVRTSGTSLVAIGKQLADYDAIDIGVFVCTHGLLDALQAVWDQNGDASLSQGVSALAALGKMSVLEIGDGFWQDVDTPEMLAHTERMLAERRSS